MSSCPRCSGRMIYDPELGGSWTCINCARVIWAQKPYVTTCKRCKKRFIDGTAFLTCGSCRTRHLRREVGGSRFIAKEAV